MRSSTRAWGHVTAVAAIAVTTAIGLLAYPTLALADLAMMYLPAVMLASLAGRGPALVAASLAVAAFDLCFVPPRFTFEIADARHLITFAVMFGAGLVISTLTERLRGQEAVAQAEAVRARTEELRSSLLASVSHDLRTPLAAITGAATTLRDQSAALTAGQRAELLDGVIDEARRLERMVTNLLGMSRVEAGLVPAREWVPVEELVGGALTRLDDVLGDRAVEVDVPAELGVPVDPVLFEQVLINVIDNAVKHGAPPLSIRARRRDHEVEIEIADRGPGLVTGDEERVFEKFHHVPRGTGGGVGLGLAVVRGVVAAHGGTVTAGSRPGGGATFRITLPAASPPPAPAAEPGVAA